MGTDGLGTARLDIQDREQGVDSPTMFSSSRGRSGARLQGEPGIGVSPAVLVFVAALQGISFADDPPGHLFSAREAQAVCERTVRLVLTHCRTKAMSLD